MTFIPAARTLQINARGTIQGQSIENVYCYRKPSAEWTLSEANIFLEDIATAMINELLPNLSSDYVLDELYAVDLSSSTSFYTTYSLNEPGDSVGDSLPSTNAAVVTWQTPQRGRSFRGRSYIAGIPEVDVNGSLMTSTLVTNLGTWAALMIEPVSSVTTELVVVSRYSEGAPRTTAVTTAVTAYRVNDVIGTQRRRRVGSGS